MEEEQLDPRIQIELEKLNSSTDVINKLELDLEEARSQFRILLNESTRKLDSLAKDLGPASVDRSRIYYDSRMVARKALVEAQGAACRYEKASSAHEAAKEMVTLAEEGFAEKGMHFDQAWQEMLNHATNRVNESEKEKNESAAEHKRKYKAYQKAESRVQELHKNLKRSINKSRPYFEAKAKYNQLLDDQKRQVQLIEETIQMTKSGYASSLKELEKISEEIHDRRQREKLLGTRGEGVGSESPGPDQVNQDRLTNGDASSSPANSAASDKPAMKSSKGIAVPPSASSPSLSLALKSKCAPAKTRPQQSCDIDSLPSMNSSNTASSSNSPVRSPSYEQLNDDAEEEEEPRGSRTPCDARQPQSLEEEEDAVDGGAVFAVGAPVRSAPIPTPLLTASHLLPPSDDMSDSESLASMDPLDDETIDRLMIEGATSLRLSEEENGERNGRLEKPSSSSTSSEESDTSKREGSKKAGDLPERQPEQATK